MKKMDISHWKPNKGFEGLLLFAQTLQESTFDYSFESYKTPALNCHYLCYDMIHTINDINKNVLKQGNFIPLAEEFEQMIQEDMFIKKIIDEKGILLYQKNKYNQFSDLTTMSLKEKIQSYAQISGYISNRCENNTAYLEFCLSEIIKNIFADTYSYDNSSKIYTVSRMILTELINIGYSKEYIYSITMDFFFNPLNPITCCEDTVKRFFDYFNGKRYNFKVKFGVNKKNGQILNELKNMTVRSASPEEKKNLDYKKIVTVLFHSK